MKDMIFLILLIWIISWVLILQEGAQRDLRSVQLCLLEQWEGERCSLKICSLSPFLGSSIFSSLHIAERPVNWPGSTMSYAKVCRDETRQLVQNIPSEECDLEPREQCKMETVLVPRLITLNRNEIFYNSIVCFRLIQKPNCIKVPKEICINVKTNPKKV